tara:strand:- start:4615 stop:4893 length:279 start_codon:yes stop_codon:yes gene_type:complete
MMAVQPANVDAFGNSSGAFSNSEVESDLSSQINGVTQSFVTPLAFNTDSLVVYYNGVRQRTGVEISIVDARNFTTTFTPQSGTVLVAVYKPL